MQHPLTRRLRLLALCLLGALFIMSPAAASSPMAPDFTLKSASGENLRLSDFRGQVVLLNFWATWCAPCRQEMPPLNALHERYQRLGFVVLGVSIDDDPRVAARMAQQLSVSYPILFDTDKRISRLYEVRAMPSTYLIDRDGRVRHVHLGYRDGYIEMYQQQVRELLQE
ncbi:peroxiredoxin-like protein [Thioalkalivibrio sulfidiphilus HL-EbGr7]|uniref:Peroxiredoxin-like protein n=1 Tax=Thioalkalivibrio sulfidiphilus (strain HL-EbGR7) TaxID=396588 RepID=B8GLP1_THISH|nr:TlpA disulfide reductase family protein [Thioalkalivibrio sulfidiphilus]ACL71644.1 peroxiredoxin-like protein [Thioalkalivibrio sulfidiphilus HL-EbGr7]